MLRRIDRQMTLVNRPVTESRQRGQSAVDGLGFHALVEQPLAVGTHVCGGPGQQREGFPVGLIEPAGKQTQVREIALDGQRGFVLRLQVLFEISESCVHCWVVL